MIGKMRHEIRLQSQVRTPDGAGGVTTTWSDVMTIWAQIEPKTSLKRFFADRLEQNISHVITTRFADGVDTKMRALFGSRVFQIHGVVNVEELGAWMILHAEEGTGS